MSTLNEIIKKQKYPNRFRKRKWIETLAKRIEKETKIEVEKWFSDKTK